MRVENVMHAGDAAPIVRAGTAMPDVIHEMSSKRLGMTCVVDDAGRLAGVVTDGDLRRLMARSSNVLALTAGEAMTPQSADDPPRAARRRGAEDHGDAQDHVGRRRRRRNAVEGVVHLHDLWRTQMF